jgi:hypothetical protein
MEILASEAGLKIVSAKERVWIGGEIFILAKQ